MVRLIRILLLSLVVLPGCAYRVGSGVMAGALDEISGKGRSDGVEKVGDRMLERAMLAELGHQLGSGLTSGATDITPEQQQRLEALIDGLLTVAAERTAKGIRNEVSPELREMVRKDIVRALAEGLRGELGDSLEHTVDRVITRATVALRKGMTSEEMRFALSDLMRDSVYYAMREGQGGTPAVAETIEFTLTQNMLEPLEQSVAGLTDEVALRVNESAAQTEARLKSVIGILIVFGSALFVLYLVRTRQLRKAEELEKAAQAELRGVDAALDLLDANTRAEIEHRREEFHHMLKPDEGYERGPKAPVKPPSDDYTR